jgi:hypothetical protein
VGVRKGYKQTPEHIRKRFLNGSPNRKGDNATTKAGRTRALRMFPVLPDGCETCGAGKRLDRHHKDGNTLNNNRDNIAFLCRKCHMAADGRLDRMKEVRRARR